MAEIAEEPDEPDEPDESDLPRDYSSELLDAMADLGYGDAELKSLARVFRAVANGDSGTSFIYADSGVLKIQISRDLRPREAVYPELRLIERLRKAYFSEEDLDRLGTIILDAYTNRDIILDMLGQRREHTEVMEVVKSQGSLEITARFVWADIEEDEAEDGKEDA